MGAAVLEKAVEDGFVDFVALANGLIKLDLFTGAGGGLHAPGCGFQALKEGFDRLRADGSLTLSWSIAGQSHENPPSSPLFSGSCAAECGVDGL